MSQIIFAYFSISEHSASFSLFQKKNLLGLWPGGPPPSHYGLVHIFLFYGVSLYRVNNLLLSGSCMPCMVFTLNGSYFPKNEKVKCFDFNMSIFWFAGMRQHIFKRTRKNNSCPPPPFRPLSCIPPVYHRKTKEIEDEKKLN